MKTKPPKTTTNKLAQIANEFHAGAHLTALAKKYHTSKSVIEFIIRGQLSENLGKKKQP